MLDERFSPLLFHPINANHHVIHLIHQRESVPMSYTPFYTRSDTMKSGKQVCLLRRISLVGLMLAVACTSRVAQAQHSVARVWDDQLLHAISIDTARPTVHARNLFHLSTAMYDAWAAYDPVASQYLHHEKLSAPDSDAARNEAISYAAYNLIKVRFVTWLAGVGPGKAETNLDLDFQMASLG